MVSYNETRIELNTIASMVIGGADKEAVLKHLQTMLVIVNAQEEEMTSLKQQNQNFNILLNRSQEMLEFATDKMKALSKSISVETTCIGYLSECDYPATEGDRYCKRCRDDSDNA